ncbi:MAG TPA: Holliday junction resolvase RuvX [Polyangiales bacterium]|nr:Holliday junction resolvase RuvX [Polyangiales bacterium]
MRRLGIDPGQRRVGLALAEDEMASPLKTLLREGDAALIALLAAEIRALDVGEVVLGLPVRMDGREGPEAKRARVLAKAITAASGVPVQLWDERMTTVAAERELRGVGMKGAKKKAVLDQAAATLLLQSYLDAQHR